jgi:hypothetical protein
LTIISICTDALKSKKKKSMKTYKIVPFGVTQGYWHTAESTPAASAPLIF